MLTIVSLAVLLATTVHGENSTKNVFGEEEKEKERERERKSHVNYVM